MSYSIPSACHDKEVHVHMMYIMQGEKDPFIRNVFTLDDCAPVVGSEVICFNKRDEAKMLQVIHTLAARTIVTHTPQCTYTADL